MVIGEGGFLLNRAVLKSGMDNNINIKDAFSYIKNMH